MAKPIVAIVGRPNVGKIDAVQQTHRPPPGHRGGYAGRHARPSDGRLRVAGPPVSAHRHRRHRAAHRRRPAGAHARAGAAGHRHGRRHLVRDGHPRGRHRAGRGHCGHADARGQACRPCGETRWTAWASRPWSCTIFTRWAWASRIPSPPCTGTARATCWTRCASTCRPPASRSRTTGASPWR